MVLQFTIRILKTADELILRQLPMHYSFSYTLNVALLSPHHEFHSLQQYIHVKIVKSKFMIQMHTQSSSKRSNFTSGFLFSQDSFDSHNIESSMSTILQMAKKISPYSTNMLFSLLREQHYSTAQTYPKQ